MPQLQDPSLPLTRNNQVTWTGLTVGYHTLATRCSQGFSEIACYIRTYSGAGTGVLHIEQSQDWFNFDQADTYNVTVAGGTVSVATKVVARFTRIRYQVPGGATHNIRFGGLLKTGASP